MEKDIVLKLQKDQKNILRELKATQELMMLRFEKHEERIQKIEKKIY